ncbi:LPXTG cell wall anchor domain-containing protein [Streptomyces sp. NPDC060064]|uniref:LPXTG cell wall anchor domain-containing protein n=1 Tax=Streptomyces sp. NPDC060064 TaxID=3347049 RepID=UPI0036A3022A
MPRRSGWRVALAATTTSLIAAASLVAAEPAFAQYPPAPGVVIDDNTVAPGDPINHTATGFQPLEQVVLSLVPAPGAAARAALRASPASVRPLASATPNGDGGGSGGGGGGGGGGGSVVLGTFTADANGIVTGGITIPARVRPGTYLYQLVGQTSGLTLSATVTVSAAPGGGNGSHPPGDGGTHPPGDGDGHGRPGDGDGDGDGDGHGRPGDGDDDGHGDGHGGGNDDGRDDGHGDENGGSPNSGHDDNGSSGHGNGTSGLADTGSSDAPVALLTAAGGLLLLGGGTLVITRRRRTDAERG